MLVYLEFPKDVLISEQAEFLVSQLQSLSAIFRQQDSISHDNIYGHLVAALRHPTRSHRNNLALICLANLAFWQIYAASGL